MIDFNNFNNVQLIICIVLGILIIIILILIVNIFFNTSSQKDELLSFTRLLHELENKIIKEERDNFEKIIKEDKNNFENVLRQNLINYKDLGKQLKESLDELRTTNELKLNEIREANEKKLNIIESNINDKLEISLNKRLDDSFKVVGEQLKSLYTAIGELQNLSVGVSDLQKTLANVKTRGIFGETQLKSILENMMIKSQYDEQVNVKQETNEKVDYVIKIPDKTNNGFIYLPIDAKFPLDTYNKYIEAINSNNEDEIKITKNQFKKALEAEAKSISEKYINVPQTTDFAIMFLATESLYAEAIRMDDLVERFQKNYKILVTGPTTIAAIINSLSIGFKYLQVNEYAGEINKILQAIKVQYNKFGEEIEDTKRKISQAEKSAEQLSKRNDIIAKNLKNISNIGEKEANKLLGLSFDE